MHIIDPEGFILHHPHLQGTQPKHTGRIVVVGPYDKWAGDGWQKLKGIGLFAYVCCDYLGKTLGFFIVPSDRNEDVLEYLYLRIVLEGITSSLCPRNI